VKEEFDTRMKKISFSKSVCAAALIAMTGSVFSCATPGKGTAIGTGGGAAVGAGAGALIGGGKGALIGAGAGALVGGAIGNYLDKQAQQLEKVAETRRTEDGILVNLKNDLLFDSGSAVLKPEANSQLVQLGQILAKYPKDQIQVAGYTDNSGAKKLNELLSQQRAHAVADVLKQQGVKSEQLAIEGKGPSEPVASNNTSTGRAKNRRVELKINVEG
jgi:outer membrane protein OmpA-like peptidoglycan-associated protein